MRALASKIRSKKYYFKERLIEGLIINRPNRFIMNVKIGGKIFKTHCPSTGRIGDIKFKNISCLVSKAPEGSNRKTQFTVEAFSLDGNKNKNWIGINQGRVNDYLNYFIIKNQLPKITGKVLEIKREVKLFNSRIDFLINGKNYLEVKTPLRNLQMDMPSDLKKEKYAEFNSFERVIKHINDISRNIKKGSRAIFAMCYIYPARKFEVPEIQRANKKIIKIARRSHLRGLETWQVNLKIDLLGIELKDYFKLKLF